MGLFAAMLGAGIGVACFGYSYVTDGRAQAQKMADAMVQALERAQLTTTGDVTLADGSTVGLEPGTRVVLAPNSTVRVDPSSIVKAPGVVNPDAHSPPASPPVQAQPVPENKVITQFTIFKKVAFDKGEVVTGWNFNNSNQATPTYQYCYYHEKAADTVAVVTDLGRDGQILDDPKARPGLDLISAFNRCTWF
jgi:hypothetical protein